jgi:hypothetical protein
MKRSREKAECQGHGASLLDDDDDDEDEDTGDDKKDLEVLQRIPDVFKKSGDGAGLSGAGSMVRAMDKDGVTPLGVKLALASKALSINIRYMLIITCNIGHFKI